MLDFITVLVAATRTVILVDFYTERAGAAIPESKLM